MFTFVKTVPDTFDCVLFRRYVSQDRVAYYLFQSNMAQKSLIAWEWLE